jgi:hypothetical protein
MSEDYTGATCPECKEESALEKLPSYWTKFYKTDGSAKQKRKTGDVVKEAIEEYKKDLKSYQDELMNEGFENDDTN